MESICFIAAFERSKAASIVSIVQMQIVYTFFVDVFFFGEKFSLNDVLGVFILVLVAVYIGVRK